MFCPKARLGERLRHRRAARRQRQAMREATAAGWKSAHNMDHDDDDDDSSDEDLENEHNLWTTPEEETLKQYFPRPEAGGEDPKTPTRSTTTTSHMKSQATTIAAAFAGRLKLFTPEYFEISADGTPRVCTSPESTAEILEEEEEDDDENSESSSSSSSSSYNDSSIVRLSEHAPESPRAPESALSAQVTAMLLLEQLQYDNHHNIINNNDSNDVTETTEEPTITDTTTDDGGGEETAYHLQEVEAPSSSSSSSRVLFPAAYSAAAATTTRHDDDDDDDTHGSNKDSDNHTSDDEDSVDYGGAETSMWQGVGNSFCSVASVTAATTKATKTTITTTSPPPPPDTTIKKAMTSLVTSTDLLVENTILLHDNDDEEEDVQHQGAQVFLYTESKTKYNLSIGLSEMNGTTTTTSTMVTNQLLDVHEVVPPSRDVTETEKIIQESSAEYQRYYREEMDFLPRFADDHEDHETSSVWEDLSYTPNGTYKSPPSTTTVTNIQQNPLRLSEILSPDNDNKSTTTTTPMIKQPQRDNLMSPLSAMVHPMNLELFQTNNNNDDDDDDDPAKDSANESGCRLDESFTSSIATEPCDLSVSSCPVQRRRGREEFVLSSSSDLIQRRSDRSVSTSRTSSSFRSSLSRGRVRYSLSTGKRSMTKAQRQSSKDFLPKSLFILPEKEIGAAVSNTKPTKKQSHNTADDDDDNNNNNTTDHRRMNSTLSVLLVHIQQHIFEVIAVDCYYKEDCTVGDVLSKARSSATDPALSEQKYISLVYDQQEFAAPMLKIHAAVDFTSSSTITTTHPPQQQEYCGDVDRRPLAIAVPEGSNGAQVQYIKKMLWKNPKMKRWWNVEDPFQPPKMEVIREIHVPSPKHNNHHDDSETKQKQ